MLFRSLPCFLLILFALFCCAAISTAAQSDPCVSSLGAAVNLNTITPSEALKIEMFKASPTGAPMGAALSPTEIETGFKVGDTVAVNITAPYCFYVYIVNVSEWDGVSLQQPYVKDGQLTDNIGTPANATKSVAFSLEKINKAASKTDREELLILVTKRKIDDPSILTVLDASSGKVTDTIKIDPVKAAQAQTELKNSLDRSMSEPTTTSKPSTVVKVMSVACKVASIFFPPAKIACSVAGLGAAVNVRATGNAIAVSPTSDQNQVVFRFSFPVKETGGQ